MRVLVLGAGALFAAMCFGGAAHAAPQERPVVVQHPPAESTAIEPEEAVPAPVVVRAAPAPQASEPVPPKPVAQVPQASLSQGDPRWKNKLLAYGVTIGKAGCLFMSLFTSVVELGYRFDVLDFLDLLRDNRLFDARGRLFWDIGKAIPGLSAERLRLSGEAALKTARDSIAAGSRVLIEVATSHGTKHWVAVVKTIGDSLLIADPDGGKVGTLSDLYSTSRVTGLAVLTQK